MRPSQNKFVKGDASVYTLPFNVFLWERYDNLLTGDYFKLIMKKMLAVSLALLSLLSLNEALRILVAFPMCSKSHNILGQGVVRHLLEAGHEVVFITSFPYDKPVPNLKEIDVGSIHRALLAQAEKYDQFKLKNMVGKTNFGETLMFMYFTYDFHNQFLEHENTTKLLSDPKEKFDAVILEWFFSESIAGIAPLFKAPMIWFVSTEAHWQALRAIDEIPNSAYNVGLFSQSRPPLTFWERSMELWIMLKKYAIMNFILMPLEKLAYNRVFPSIAAKRGVELPSYNEAVYNGSIMFFNSHPSIGTPFKLPQNAKYVAGYHIDDKVPPLSMELQKIMSDSKYGVIYFSMGSNLKSMDMTSEMRESLLKMFGNLKETIIWKFEGDIDKVPSNVHLVKWAPQLNILSHPKLKFFITHGGQLSTTEAIHFGVPVIGIPVLGDQHVNMRAVENKGFGIHVDLTEDLANSLSVAIREMSGNPSYKWRAKELSAIYHDRPVCPGAELVHWVEHVVKTRGALHLRSPALHVPWYQKLYLDLLAIICLIVYLMYRSLIFVSKRFMTKKKEKRS